MNKWIREAWGKQFVRNNTFQTPFRYKANSWNILWVWTRTSFDYKDVKVTWSHELSTKIPSYGNTGLQCQHPRTRFPRHSVHLPHPSTQLLQLEVSMYENFQNSHHHQPLYIYICSHPLFRLSSHATTEYQVLSLWPMSHGIVMEKNLQPSGLINPPEFGLLKKV